MKPSTTHSFGLATLLALGALVAGCRPPIYPVKLNPVAAQTRWLMGRNFAVQSDSLAIVAVAFDYSNYKQVHFSVEVTNLSGTPLLVAPENFTYIFTPDSTLRTWRGDSMIAALDPEPNIRSLRRSIEAEESSYRREVNGRNVEAIVGGIVQVAQAVAGSDGKSGETGKESSKERERRQKDSAEAAERANKLAEAIKRDEEHELAMINLNALERDWSDALRKTTLGQRESIRGDVIFEQVQQARGVRLTIPLGARKYVFTFRQELDK